MFCHCCCSCCFATVALQELSCNFCFASVVATVVLHLLLQLLGLLGMPQHNCKTRLQNNKCKTKLENQQTLKIIFETRPRTPPRAKPQYIVKMHLTPNSRTPPGACNGIASKAIKNPYRLCLPLYHPEHADENSHRHVSLISRRKKARMCRRMASGTSSKSGQELARARFRERVRTVVAVGVELDERGGASGGGILFN